MRAQRKTASKSKADVSRDAARRHASPARGGQGYGAPAGMPPFLAHGTQRKLAIGAVNDPLEREAEHAGHQALNASPAATGIHPSHASAETHIDADRIQPALASPSRPLDRSLRRQFERQFGQSLPPIRIHSGAAAARSAEELNAKAYTVGGDIVFGPQRFAPHSDAGQRLLAHELTHVLQQSNGAPVLQRDPKDPAAPALSAPQMTEEEAEAWYREMNIDENFSDPTGPFDVAVTDEEWAKATEEWLQQSLTPEEMHRQLLVRRAQRLGASAYQAADPIAARAGMDHRIAGIESDIKARKENIASLEKQGPSTEAAVRTENAQVKALEKDMRALKKARERLSRTTQLSRMGTGRPVGTGQITYAGIQIETAEGKRLALEFAETTTTEHAEEVMIRQIKTQLTPEQLRGARVTVVGDQVVCSGRCVPALREFAVENGIESVDGIVFQRYPLNTPAGFEGPIKLASPRTTLRTMTQSSSEGTELFRRELVIYRRSATSAVERVAAEETPLWIKLARNFISELKNITPATLGRFGLNLLKEAGKGLATAVIVDYIIGDSKLEEDLAALDAANNVPHDDTPEKVRSFEKFAISLLPPEVAIPLAGAIRTMNPLSPEFLYEATVQENQRKWEEFKKDYGDSDEAWLLYLQGQKQADDWANGITPWDQ